MDVELKLSWLIIDRIIWLVLRQVNLVMAVFGKRILNSTVISICLDIRVLLKRRSLLVLHYLL